ncbi:hypothetical protein [Leifsonia sp. P73]|uniref:hypothetical protein n=1 Tax=Leifsonia sp. P73 TaxID=3423959 RepID=UPI003DA3A562
MTADDARGVLERCIAGRVSLHRLTTWAEAVEGRDDIELDAKSPADLATLLFELSNPKINNPSLDTIRVWSTRLRQVASSTDSTALEAS